MKKLAYLKILGFIVMAQLAGAIGGIATSSSLDPWYSKLNKPWFNPPDNVFAPVWIVLYTMMGVAAYIVYSKGKKEPGVRNALYCYLIQLALNVFWPIVFFGFRSLFFGFVNIVLLWIFILFTIYFFYKESKIASFIMIPYFLWVTFAVFLNFTLWKLN